VSVRQAGPLCRSSGTAAGGCALWPCLSQTSDKPTYSMRTARDGCKASSPQRQLEWRQDRQRARTLLLITAGDGGGRGPRRTREGGSGSPTHGGRMCGQSAALSAGRLAGHVSGRAKGSHGGFT
jgi:hypothetical protein